MSHPLVTLQDEQDRDQPIPTLLLGKLRLKRIETRLEFRTSATTLGDLPSPQIHFLVIFTH